MYIFLCILIAIACILLIGVVLIQKSKGGGLASDYSSGNQIMGYRKTTDFVEKTTWTLAICVCVFSIAAAFAIKTPQTKSSINNAAPQQTEAPATPTNNATPAPAPAPAPATPAK